MPDYSNGKIYTLRCRNDTTLIYVGSTIQPLCKRFSGHKNRSLKHPEMLIYKTINNDWKNWYIELYELFPCNCKEELLKKEGEIIRLISSLNKQIAGRTITEWIKDNKEKLKENHKQYYENNKEKIKEKVNKYKNKNYEKIKEKKNTTFVICSCGCEINKNNKSQHLKSKSHQLLISNL